MHFLCKTYYLYSGSFHRGHITSHQFSLAQQLTGATKGVHHCVHIFIFRLKRLLQNLYLAHPIDC